MVLALCRCCLVASLYYRLLAVGLIAGAKGGCILVTAFCLARCCVEGGPKAT